MASDGLEISFVHNKQSQLQQKYFLEKKEISTQSFKLQVSLLFSDTALTVSDVYFVDTGPRSFFNGSNWWLPPMGQNNPVLHAARIPSNEVPENRVALEQSHVKGHKNSLRMWILLVILTYIKYVFHGLSLIFRILLLWMLTMLAKCLSRLVDQSNPQNSQTKLAILISIILQKWPKNIFILFYLASKIR